ncbi:MAG: UDP binding domain-containing protein, partial [Burkholderiaceae bacterium]
IDINADQPNRLVELIERHHPSVQGKQVAVLGIAFKPGTDDVRESPSLTLVEQLREKGAKVSAFDPIAMDTGREALGSDGIDYAGSIEECIDGADIVVVATSWPEFRQLPELLKASGAKPLVVDGRRMFNPADVPAYEGIGLSLA